MEKLWHLSPNHNPHLQRGVGEGCSVGVVVVVCALAIRGDDSDGIACRNGIAFGLALARLMSCTLN